MSLFMNEFTLLPSVISFPLATLPLACVLVYGPVSLVWTPFLTMDWGRFKVEVFMFTVCVGEIQEGK